MLGHSTACVLGRDQGSSVRGVGSGRSHRLELAASGDVSWGMKYR